MKRTLILITKASLAVAAMGLTSCATLSTADPSATDTSVGDVRIQGLSTSSVVRYEKRGGGWQVAEASVHRESGSDTISKLAGAGADIAFGVAALRHSKAALREADAYQQIADDGLTLRGININNASTSVALSSNTNTNELTNSNLNNN